MIVVDLQKDFIIFFTLTLLEKVFGDHLLKQNELPSLIVLLSSLLFLIISFFKSTRVIYFKIKWIILISALLTYDSFIKTYINLASTSNLKEIVMENVYLIAVNILNARVTGIVFLPKQNYAMVCIVVFGIIQISYPYFKYDFIDLHPRDFFNFLGTLGGAVGLIIFKEKVERKVKSVWNYTLTLSLYNSIFAGLIYAFDIVVVKKGLVFNISLSETFVVLFLSGLSDLYFNRLTFSVQPYVLLTSLRLVNFINSLLSDLINQNSLDIFSFILAVLSTIASQAILYYDEENSFF
ncbi:hypothetical protein HERIO_767 [Hepatospora eriocheir]|uniref:Uncharacterized protein n=1 Tax=Hepatospora eriocheir TaxID=1081669 RepID=A0A1X0QC44_9MICR|nr:hypothetical protein HERIO_767 [Hepatospora eriocheir]